MPEFTSQEETAAWMDTTVEQMNADHDDIHEFMCSWINVPSMSLAVRDELPHDMELAWYEEDAVLHFQRWYYQLIKKGYIKL